jgi:hypothetical protein
MGGPEIKLYLCPHQSVKLSKPATLIPPPTPPHTFRIAADRKTEQEILVRGQGTEKNNTTYLQYFKRPLRTRLSWNPGLDKIMFFLFVGFYCI